MYELGYSFMSYTINGCPFHWYSGWGRWKSHIFGRNFHCYVISQKSADPGISFLFVVSYADSFLKSISYLLCATRRWPSSPKRVVNYTKSLIIIKSFCCHSLLTGTFSAEGPFCKGRTTALRRSKCCILQSPRFKVSVRHLKHFIVQQTHKYIICRYKYNYYKIFKILNIFLIFLK